MTGMTLGMVRTNPNMFGFFRVYLEQLFQNPESQLFYSWLAEILADKMNIYSILLYNGLGKEKDLSIFYFL